MTSTDGPAQDWQQLVCSYYNGCSSGDVDLMLRTLHPDVEHWFLAPNTGSTLVAGAEHLARYWRKVTGMLSARWVVDALVTSDEQAVIEWTMFWSPPPGGRVATRGAEWFTRQDGLIREIRSYYAERYGAAATAGLT